MEPRGGEVRRGTTGLLDPVTLAGRTAPCRVIFGPHETNLGSGRALSARHVAYYQRRAAGGAGIIVTEVASVHESDWPYERAPLAADCRDGWRQIADACHARGALVLAGLGHTGLQGSSAFSQRELWGPSGFTDVVSRETPMVMEQPQIDAVIRGFAAAAAAAAESGADGVEVDAGPGALLRQFHSGLTNQRADGYGSDRLALTRAVLSAVRAAIGRERVLALRLSCDELAPWAGVTPEIAAGQAAGLAPLLDLLTVVRGGPYSAGAYRPDGHTPPMFNLELSRAIRAAVRATAAAELAALPAEPTGPPAPGAQSEPAAHTEPGLPPVLVALQGSVVDVGPAQAALDGGAADLVEMTRAQIADADLVAKLRAGHAERIRPCILCNQTCRVRDNRNPIVTCVGDPRSGHETQDPPVDPPEPGLTPALAELTAQAPQATPPEPGPPPALAELTARAAEDPAIVAAATTIRRDVLVVGGGPAGLEAARVAALRGHAVRLAERSGQLGGTLRAAAIGPARERMALLADWLEAECWRLGARLDTGVEITAADLDAARAGSSEIILATGSRPVARFDPGVTGDALPAPTVDALSALTGANLPDGPVVVHDPVGGPVGVAVAEWLAARGRQVAIVAPDQIIGTLLSLTGDLADANVRLQRAGVTRELRSLLRDVSGSTALLEDVWTGEQRRIGCAVLVDCGHRLPDEALYEQRPGTPRAGDCVAPRTVHEAILEGRRAALAIGAARHQALQRERVQAPVLK
ncbi:MAG: FAD-dependent oxidoreductase [Streptosporangiaceae bacterium]|jgi:2,4-dienoyl-CoA reductase (NADPH2)